MFTHDFGDIQASYVCPECTNRRQITMSYPKNQKKVSMEKAYWCKCGARHKIKYQVSVTRKGGTRLRVIEFLSNDIEHKSKRFRQEV